MLGGEGALFPRGEPGCFASVTTAVELLLTVARPANLGAGRGSACSGVGLNWCVESGAGEATFVCVISWRCFVKATELGPYTFKGSNRVRKPGPV